MNTFRLEFASGHRVVVERRTNTTVTWRVLVQSYTPKGEWRMVESLGMWGDFNYAMSVAGRFVTKVAEAARLDATMEVLNRGPRTAEQVLAEEEAQ